MCQLSIPRYTISPESLDFCLKLKPIDHHVDKLLLINELKHFSALFILLLFKQLCRTVRDKDPHKYKLKSCHYSWETEHDAVIVVDVVVIEDDPEEIAQHHRSDNPDTVH